MPSNYVGEINEFMAFYKLSTGKIYLAKMEVFSGDQMILAETCEISITRNIGYQQTDLNIIWEDEELCSRNNIRCGYNTNFHLFSFNNNVLTIVDNNHNLTLKTHSVIKRIN